VWAAPL
jgi:hypothetical protein